MSWRLRSVRKRILLLAFVPVLSLVGIYTFYTSISARAAINLARAGTLKVQTTVPEGNILVALNTERPAAMVYLAAPTAADLANFNAEVQKTNRAVTAAHAALTSSATTNSASPGEQHAIDVLLAAVRTLPGLHTQITNRAISRPAALVAYDGVVQDVYQAIIQSIRQETSATVVNQALALIEAARSEEALSEEAALMAGDFAAQNFPSADRHEVAELAGTRRTLYSAAQADLDPQYRMYWTRNVTPQTLGTLTALENKLISDSAVRRLPPPISPLAWEQALGAVAAGLTKASNEGAVAVDRDASNVAWGTARGLLIVGGLGLLAVIVSIIVAIFTGRSLVRELRDLRDSALDLANNQLPQVVDRLALGQAVNVSTEAPQLPCRHRGGAPGQRRLRHGAKDRGAGRGGAGEAAAGHERCLPQPGPAQSVLAPPPAHAPGRHGAPGPRPPGARGPLPHRPPDDPHAPARREPDHPVRPRARARLAEPGPAGGRAPGGGGRGGGLHPDQGHRGDPGRAHWPGCRRRHSPDR